MRILCVCTGNTCRSPMFMVLLARSLALAGVADVIVESAGLLAANDMPASLEAVSAMRRRGLDLTAHRSRPVSAVDLRGVDIFVCMSGHHALGLIELGVRVERVAILAEADGGVPDPYGAEAEAYERCAMVLERESTRLARVLAQGEATRHHRA